MNEAADYPKSPTDTAALLSWWLAVFVLVLASGNLILGWGFGFEVAVRGLDGLRAMVPDTALSFALLALARIIAVSVRPVPWLSAALAAGAAGLAWFDVVVLQPGSVLADTDDRLSLATLVIVSLLSASQLVSVIRPSGQGRAALGLALMALCIGMGGLAAFSFDVNELDRYRLFRGLSLPTALSACVMSVSLIFGCTQIRIVGILFAPTSGGRLARGLMPTSILIPILLTLGGDLAADAGLIRANARLAALAAILIGISVVISLGIGLYQDIVAEQDVNLLRFLEKVLQGLDTGLAALDDNGVPDRGNPRFRALFGETDGTGKQPPNWPEGLAFRSVEDDTPLVGAANPMRRALASDAPVLARYLAPDGTDLVLQIMVFRTEAIGAVASQSILVISDITHAWKQRAAMAQTERLEAVGQLAGGVAHEVTNIFGIIKLAVGTAQLIAPTGAPEQYAAILNACRRGGTLAERLQRLSVASTGQHRTVDVVTAVGAAATLVERGLPPGQRLERDLPEEPVFVSCDPVELEMAVINLVLNARNAISETGQADGLITVSVAVRDGVCCLTVGDNGPGIPSGVIDHVLEPMFTTRQERGGTGFGLALIDSFATGAGGDLSLSSQPGAGTSVLIQLPLAAEAVGPTEDLRPSPVPLASVRILVVEDDVALKTMLAGSLSALGADITLAEAPTDVPDRVATSGPFDVLISALNFNIGLSGRDVAQKALQHQPDLGVVFVTADRDGAREAGGLPGPVLEKPVHLGVLSHAIAGVMEMRQGSV